MRSSSEAEYGEFAATAWPKLYRTALMLLGDRQLAEDLVQSALVKTYVAWPRLRAPEKAQAYTRRAMVNLARDWFRKRSWTHESAADLTTTEGAPTADPTASLVERVTLAALLQTLPPGQRSVLVLRFLDDLSVQETANLLNISAGTVKSQTSAALASLRARAELLTESRHHD